MENHYILSIPHLNTNPYGYRRFSVAAPTQWNKLPNNMRETVISPRLHMIISSTGIYLRFILIKVVGIFHVLCNNIRMMYESLYSRRLFFKIWMKSKNVLLDHTRNSCSSCDKYKSKCKQNYDFLNQYISLFHSCSLLLRH